MDLTPQQLAVLERLRQRGFSFAAFPLFAQQIGVKKGNCAALLAPQDGGSLKVFGEPSYLVEGQLGVRVRRNGVEFFVWKQKELQATAERNAELERFRDELAELLLPVA